MRSSRRTSGSTTCNLVSCKYPVRDPAQPEPGPAGRRIVEPGSVDDARDWYERVAPLEYQELYEICVQDELGLPKPRHRDEHHRAPRVSRPVSVPVGPAAQWRHTTASVAPSPVHRRGLGGGRFGPVTRRRCDRGGRMPPLRRRANRNGDGSRTRRSVVLIAVASFGSPSSSWTQDLVELLVLEGGDPLIPVPGVIHRSLAQQSVDQPGRARVVQDPGQVLAADEVHVVDPEVDGTTSSPGDRRPPVH